MKLTKTLQICGALGPLNFFLVTLISGFIFPNYDFVSQYISELGAVDSPVKDRMNILGLMLSGLFLVLFSIQVYLRLGKNLSGKIGSLFLLFSGLGMIAIGHYPCDPGCNTYSPIGEMHELSTIFTFACAVISLLFLGYSIRGDKSLKSLSSYSFLIAILTVVFIYLFNFLETDYAGLFERLAAFIPLGFVAVLAWIIYTEKSK